MLNQLWLSSSTHTQLVSEMRNLIDRYKLPDIIDGKQISKLKWKTTVKWAIKTTYERELKEKIARLRRSCDSYIKYLFLCNAFYSVY